MNDFAQEIKRLQKLSCIALSPEEEKKLGSQLADIIAFLGKLPEPKGTSGSEILEGKLTLRTIEESNAFDEPQKLLKNVKHPILNNSIVIKSVLD